MSSSEIIVIGNGLSLPSEGGKKKSKKNFNKKKRKTDTIPEPEPLSSSRCLSLMSLPCNWTWWMLALFSPRTRFVLSTPSDISGPGRLFSEHNSVPACLVKCWGLNCQLYVVMRMFLCFFFLLFSLCLRSLLQVFFFSFFFAYGCGESERLCGVCAAWVRRLPAATSEDAEKRWYCVRCEHREVLWTLVLWMSGSVCLWFQGWSSTFGSDSATAPLKKHLSVSDQATWNYSHNLSVVVFF